MDRHPTSSYQSAIWVDNGDQSRFIPDEVLGHICGYCDRYRIRANHRDIVSTINRVGMTRRVMTPEWAGPFEEEFHIWWKEITIPYTLITDVDDEPDVWYLNKIDPLETNTCMSLHPTLYEEYRCYQQGWQTSVPPFSLPGPAYTT